MSSADSTAPAHSTAPAATGVSAIVESIAAVLPSSEDVHAQLEQAKATIARLTSQTQEQGLRQRKTEAFSGTERSRGGTTTGVQQGTPNGVPVPMVAALCLMSFLIAYLLF